MKNLWMFLPPLLADNFGMIEVLRRSDGCGVIDDSGEFRLSAGRHSGPDTRVTVSAAENTDVIVGTKAKLLSQAREIARKYDPAFLLFSAGPCGAMIGTDLGEVAEEFGRESGLLCGAVELTGQKTYDVGIAKTLEGMAKLLTEPADVQEGCVSLIGATTLDWSEDDLKGIRRWIEGLGYRVIAQPGANVTAEQVRRMARAELNVVTTVSGLSMARYLEREFGTPYVAYAPFGADVNELLRGEQEATAEGAQQTTLIVAEQMTGNAVRRALERLRPGESAQVCTFYQLDKKLARSGDRKLKGEADVRALLASGQFARVIADPMLRRFAAESTKWIDLPHRTMHTYGDCDMVPLLGEKCDRWLKDNL